MTEAVHRRNSQDPLRKYTEAERPLPPNGPAACYDCLLEYGSPAWADVVLPDDVWERINPTHHRGAGLLCFSCINARLVAAGIENTPVIIASGPMTRPWRWVKGSTDATYADAYEAIGKDALTMNMTPEQVYIWWSVGFDRYILSGEAQPTAEDSGWTEMLDTMGSSYPDTLAGVGMVVTDLRELPVPPGLETTHAAALMAAEKLGDYVLTLQKAAEKTTNRATP